MLKVVQHLRFILFLSFPLYLVALSIRTKMGAFVIFQTLGCGLTLGQKVILNQKLVLSIITDGDTILAYQKQNRPYNNLALFVALVTPQLLSPFSRFLSHWILFIKSINLQESFIYLFGLLHATTTSYVTFLSPLFEQHFNILQHPSC